MKLKKLNLMLGASIAVLAMPVAAMAQDATGAQQEVTSEVVSDAELAAVQNSDALLMQAQVAVGRQGSGLEVQGAWPFHV